MKNNNNLGQYDSEYQNCSCFWGTSPGKYVELLLKYLKKGTVLDLGAGEGKNSIFIAQQGMTVTAVDCSVPGLKNFKKRLDEMPLDIKNRISIINSDVKQYDPSQKFDAVIAYGLLHCLPSQNDIDALITKMKSWTIDGGYNVVVSFTPHIPVPESQNYLKPTFVIPRKLLSAYEDWRILHFEEDTITETHPTTNQSHSHSLCRLLAQRVYD